MKEKTLFAFPKHFSKHSSKPSSKVEYAHASQLFRAATKKVSTTNSLFHSTFCVANSKAMCCCC